ncbi:ABC transporter ATP-binding protein [Humibacter ginsenosidimutans]|uniref:ABC-type quaternary amine transporter n=1 Tax=Humibacter ginsenosidimutans TaxID=2599293 RepID=A0A5B8LZT9_9MICO|nr:ABC transporter ATP-binding protein [Humibacter ginsenosidimutans]QDZ13643.1 ABC transporter ATP-binding protein [Humibacter ginsenosidimutans]
MTVTLHDTDHPASTPGGGGPGDTGPLTIKGTAVELVDIVKTYGSHRALQGVTLSINPGEFVALLGPSGCGKTTMLRALSGLERVDAGSILIDGTDVAAVAANRRDIGMVFQSYSLFPHLTATQNVEFGLRMRRVDARKRAARAAEALDLVGLASFGERYPHELSGGQQQRVALARALVTRPRVLLLDEPLSALDAKVRVQLREEIRRIQRELGITTVFVTHDQEEALAVADRVAVMNAGAIEQIGTPEELYLQPSTPFVADFVGLSNRLPGVADGDEVVVFGRRLTVLGESASGEVTALIRPEDLELDERAGGADDALPAVVVGSSFLGSMRRTTVRFEDGTLASVQHDVRDRPVPDAAVHVRFKGRPVVVRSR